MLSATQAKCIALRECHRTGGGDLSADFAGPDVWHDMKRCSFAAWEELVSASVATTWQADAAEDRRRVSRKLPRSSGAPCPRRLVAASTRARSLTDDCQPAGPARFRVRRTKSCGARSLRPRYPTGNPPTRTRPRVDPARRSSPRGDSAPRARASYASRNSAAPMFPRPFATVAPNFPMIPSRAPSGAESASIASSARPSMSPHLTCASLMKMVSWSMFHPLSGRSPKISSSAIRPPKASSDNSSSTVRLPAG